MNSTAELLSTDPAQAPSSVPASGARPRIKVLHILTANVRGGIEEGVLSLLSTLDREQFEPALAAPPLLLQAYGADVERLGISTYPLPAMARPWHLAGMAQLRRVLREAKPDLVHTHLFVTTMCVAPVAKLCGVPIVIESCRIREGWRNRKSYWIDRQIERFVDVNIAISNSLREYLVHEKGFPAKKLVLIRNGRELARVLGPPKKRAEELRKELGLGSGDLVIAVSGRLETQKGHRYLLQALPSVRERFPPLRVLVIGEGSLRQEIESEVRARGLSDCVLLTGYRKDVYDILRISDLVVLPSLFEGLPLVAIEAGALGKAIVATSVDGTPEVVLHGETGWLVPPADSAALGEAICKLLGDPVLCQRMGARAREYVTREYSFDRLARETEALYTRLCAGGES